MTKLNCHVFSWFEKYFHVFEKYLTLEKSYMRDLFLNRYGRAWESKDFSFFGLSHACLFQNSIACSGYNYTNTFFYKWRVFVFQCLFSLQHVHFFLRVWPFNTILLILSWASLVSISRVGPHHHKTFLMPYANNKGADQPAHLCSLISTFIFTA